MVVLLYLATFWKLISFSKYHQLSGIGKVTDYRIKEVRDHTGNEDKPCSTDIDSPCSDKNIWKKLLSFFHRCSLCNFSILAPAFFLCISVKLFYIAVFQCLPKSSFIVNTKGFFLIILFNCFWFCNLSQLMFQWDGLVNFTRAEACPEVHCLETSESQVQLS